MASIMSIIAIMSDNISLLFELYLLKSIMSIIFVWQLLFQLLCFVSIMQIISIMSLLLLLFVY